MAGTQEGDGGDLPDGGLGAPRETFNPWTVVNLVFHHLAAQGLHPVLGGHGDPAVAATALLRDLGIEPGRNDESVTSPLVQDRLAQVRAHFFGEGREGEDVGDSTGDGPVTSTNGEAVPRPGG